MLDSFSALSVVQLLSKDCEELANTGPFLLWQLLKEQMKAKSSSCSFKQDLWKTRSLIFAARDDA